MLPITRPAPVITTNGGDNAGSWWRYKHKAKQAKPYTLPLPYWFVDVRCVQATLFGYPPWGDFGNLANAGATKGPLLCGPSIEDTWPDFGSMREHLLNSARSKLLSKINTEGAMLAVNYAERKQSFGMMTARLEQLGRFALNLKRGDIAGAAKALSLNPNSRKVKKIKDRYARVRSVSGAWLEFHFGWEPLVKDIYGAVDILDSSPDADAIVPVKVSVSRPFADSTSQHIQHSETTWVRYQRRMNGRLRVKCGANYSISNPILWKASQLGLTNPIAVAWELIPFSFVVDWFSTLGEYINQISDTMGVEIINPWYSHVCEIGQSTYHEYGVRIGEDYVTLVPFDKFIALQGLYVGRELGLPGVTLKVRLPKQASIARVSTAISLLLQRMPKG